MEIHIPLFHPYTTNISGIWKFQQLYLMYESYIMYKISFLPFNKKIFKSPDVGAAKVGGGCNSDKIFTVAYLAKEPLES